MLKVLDARVVSVKYKMRKRGSALLLVVVLVLMLAMMGTAFLMTVRISRDQIAGTGSSIVILPEADYWPNIPGVSGQLDVGSVEVRGLLQTEIQNGVIAGGVYRDPADTTADFVVSPDSTEFLAARNPSLPDATKLFETRWDAISSLPSVAGFTFGSPFPGGTLAASRQDLFTGAFRVPYPAPFDAVPTLAGKVRIFPALATAGAGPYLMAADADGDGIADSGMFRLTGTTSPAVTLKDGAAHPVSYWGAVRVIDNNGAVNVNTAWRSTADRFADGTPVPGGSYISAYLGAFRPNVGLYELLRGVDVAASRVSLDASVDSDVVGATGLDRERMGNLPNASAEMLPDPGDTAAARTDAVYITQGDSLEHQLARRLKVGGYNYATPPAQYAVLPSADIATDLAYHFCLLNPNLTATSFRNVLNWSLFRNSPNYSDDLRKRAGFRYFGANQSDFWYHTIFNTDSSTTVGTNPYVGTRAAYFANTNSVPRVNNQSSIQEPYVRKTVRQHLVEANPISVAVADPATAFTALPAEVKDTAGDNHNLMPAIAGETPTKANVNIGTYGQLWRAYWSVFASAPGALPQARVASRRGGALTWDAQGQLLTRAALAAVNTITARNPEITFGTYTLPATEQEHARAESRTFRYGAYDVTVYGLRKQPFITEVLIHRDENGVQYVGVELYNPHSTPITLSGYRFASLIGNAMGATVATIPAATTINPHEYLTVQDGTAPNAPNPVTVTGNTVTAGGLIAMVAPGSEIVLLRTRRDDGGASPASAVANDTYDEANVYDLIPVDQFNADVNQPLPAAGQFDRFQYVRTNVASGGLKPFRAVWAGDLVLHQSAGANPDQGTLGADNLNTDTGGMQPDISIPLANTFSDLIHPLRVGSATDPNRFPFGAFARDGDIASVPYIGHYRISAAGNPAMIYELNSVTVDATYADDGPANVGNNADEPVGRFVPMIAMTGDATVTETYPFAKRLFDYLTAVDVVNDATTPEEVTTPQVERDRYMALTNAAPTEVAANAPTALDSGSQGRININTAPWQVLAALPLVPVNPADAAIDTPAKAAARTEQIAKAIVLDRETNGEFASIFDLNRVVDGANHPFRDAVGTPASGDFTYTQGDLSQLDGLTDDYEQRIQEITRISNLITTRSDSFTAYVLVQAWIDAGTANAVLAAERRYVYQIDRWKMNAATPTADVSAALLKQ